MQILAFKIAIISLICSQLSYIIFANNIFTLERKDKFENTSEYRIVGGVIADKHEFPSIVLILIADIQSCGGTIIKPNWVLTAAHCLDSGVHPGAITLVAGAHTLVDEEEKKNRQCRRAARYHIHPDYRVSTFINDAALLHFETPFNFNTNVNSAKLPPLNGVIQTSKKSFVAGWGRYRNEIESPSNVLRKVELSFVRNEKCRQMYAPSVKIVDDMICAGEKGKDACSGDSGGPLFCNMWNPQEETFLCGIVSVGTKYCGKAHPGIYTRVTSYVDWIEKTIKRYNQVF